MPIKPHRGEEEYFAREEALKKQKIALAEAKRLVEKQREELKDTHWMHCPKCGMTLQTITYRDVEVDRCFNCNGVWLDDGELEKVAAQERKNPREGTWVKSVLNIFEPPNKKSGKKK